MNAAGSSSDSDDSDDLDDLDGSEAGVPKQDIKDDKKNVLKAKELQEDDEEADDEDDDEGDDHSDRTDSSKGVVERFGSMGTSAPAQVSNSTTGSGVTNGSELEPNHAARSNYWNNWHGRQTLPYRNFGYIELAANSATLIKEAISRIVASCS